MLQFILNASTKWKIMKKYSNVCLEKYIWVLFSKILQVQVKEWIVTCKMSLW